MSSYYIRLKIGDTKYESEVRESATCRSLYRVARSLARWGRRNHVNVRFIVTNLNTGRTIFRLYARESEKRGWIARQVGAYDDI